MGGISQSRLMLKQGRNLPWKAVIKTKRCGDRKYGTPGRPSLPVLPVYMQKKCHAEDRLINNHVDVSKPKRLRGIKRPPVDFKALVIEHLTKHAYSTLPLIAKNLRKGKDSTRLLLNRMINNHCLVSQVSLASATLYALSVDLFPTPQRTTAPPKPKVVGTVVRVMDAKKDVVAYLGIHPKSPSSHIRDFLRVSSKRMFVILNALEQRGIIARAYDKDKPDVLWSLLTP